MSARWRGHDREQAGFSLLEVLVAVTILGFGLVGVLEAITSALAASQEAEVRTTALFLADGLLAELLVQGGFDVATEEEEGAFGEDDEESAGFARYRWIRRIEELNPEGLYRLTVVVEHQQRGSWQPVEELTTLAFESPVAEERDEPDATREPWEAGTGARR